MVYINEKLLNELLPEATSRDIERFLVPLNYVFIEYNITTSLRIAAFLAQIGNESDSLRCLEDTATGANHDYRGDLGNTEFEAIQIAEANYSSPGRWFKGRGLIQCTGYYNYKRCGEVLKIDCLRSPTLLCEPINASRSAGWFWEKNKCNSLADLGLFNSITKIVNGGYTNREEGFKLYKNACEILDTQ